MDLDKTGLLERTFVVPALTNERTYSFVCNLETNVSRWSKNAVDYFGLPGEYMYDVNPIWEQHIHPDDLASYRRAYEAFWEEGKEKYKFEYRARNKDGEYVPCTCHCIILKGVDGEPDLFTGTIVNHQIYEKIDAVTSLHNDKEFVERIDTILHTKQQAAVLEIALNRFSQLNEMHGYEYGNKVLLIFGERIRKMIADKGEAYRLDGAKFAVILFDVDEIACMYEKLQWIAGHAIQMEDTIVPMSLSGSALILEEEYGTVQFVKSCLSFALNQSKREKHGQLVFFCDKSGEDARKLKLIAKVHQSILEGYRGFYLRYQPIVDVGKDTIIGAEALLRWRDEEYGDVAPGIFIPWIESVSAFYELGNWILHTALCDAVHFRKIIPEFIININIAASQLERKEFRQAITSMIQETGFPPENLFIELTERCRHLDYEFLKEEMAYLHEQGINVSLDDFGTGSSSLSLLKELPIDELKVDMSFIRNIQENPADQAIVGAIVHCAKNMKVKTCFEGVESEELSQYLSKFGATYYQGYYYAKPVLRDEFEELLQSNQNEKTTTT